MSFRTIKTVAVGALLMATTASAQSLAVNGGFETGDTSGWESFPSINSTFEVTGDANTGSFGARIFNGAETSGAVIKQANRGEGVVMTGQTITVSFAAKGMAGIGGVAFAEFFTEIAGGGVSSSRILGGGPLPLTSTYQPFSFDVLIGAVDVSGGITVQFAAVTGADVGSEMTLFLDDVVITGPDAPVCTGDIADDFGTLNGGDGMISFGDFLALLGLIGPCPGSPGCTGDIADDFGTLNGGDGMISFGDFLALLGLIGPCP